MAVANASPTIDVHVGAAAFAEDIPKVLRAVGALTIGDVGWSQPDKLTLLVPVSGIHQGRTESFLLRLGFQAYRSWPPSAQFVNPETRAFVYPADQHHVPILANSECNVHLAYPRPGGNGTTQLLCCSATLEFYEVLHSVEQHHLWRDTDTFLTTINAVRKAMAASFQGRYPIHGQ